MSTSVTLCLQPRNERAAMNGGFSHNGKTLLSGVNPAKRADRIAETVTVMDRTLYICPSPLFGYGLELLLARLTGFSGSAVLCVEADSDLYTLAWEQMDAMLRENQKLRLTNICEAGALCALLRQEWGPRFFRRVEVVRLSGGWQLFPVLYDTLAEALRREIAIDWGNAITLARLGRRYIRNAIRNIALFPLCDSLGQLSFGNRPVLVLGAGPSLDTALDTLFRRGLAAHTTYSLEKRSFNIVCVDTCLPALRERGIRPDLAVILESQHWNLGDFIGLSGWKVPAALDLSALPRSGHVLSGDLFLFCTPWTNLSIFGRLERAGLLPVTLPPLGSVGLSAAIIARRLTRGPVIVTGLDFSFTLDSYHARSTPGHLGRLCTHNRCTSLLNAEAAFGKMVVKTAGKNGARVLSSASLRNYRDLFEREFAAVPQCFDIDGSGLPLGIPAILPETAIGLLSGHTQCADAAIQDMRPVTRAGSSALTEKLRAFIRDEQACLTLLRDMLTGAAPPNPDTLASLVNDCDYVWSHFPDYAAVERHFSADELAAGGSVVISFLKRLRAETDPFLKLWEMTLKMV